MLTIFLITLVGAALLLVDFAVVAAAINDYQYGRATIRRTAGVVTAAVALLALYIWIAVALDTDAVR
ncbi:MAG: hypothetical protein M3Q19_12805 [Pseudomonadota bacterium]|nr:hypothetical protein [Pseudomonadota bacterium]